MARARLSAVVVVCLLACGASPKSGRLLDGDAINEGGDNDDSGDSANDGDSGQTTVTQRMLVVRSAGVEIGYLEYVSEFTIGVWDPGQDLVFAINDVTGFMGTGITRNYESSDCSGNVWWTVVAGACDIEGLTPNRRRVVRPDADTYGFTQPTELLIQAGPLTSVSLWSFGEPSSCTTRGTAAVVCAFELVPTTAIPTAFALPITITEE